MKNQKKRMGELDALKGMSAVVIALLYHYKDYWIQGGTNPMDGIPVIWHLVLNGRWLVELFYIISGFTLYIGYKKKVLEAGGYSFFIKRLVRIMPVMDAAVLSAWILQWIIKWITGSTWCAPDAGLDTWHTFYALLGLQHLVDTAANIIPASWFIGPLFLCYALFWPLMKFAAKKENGWTIFLLPFLIGVALSSVDWLGHPLVNQSIGVGLMNFFFGVLLRMAMDAIENSEHRAAIERLITRLVLCLSALLLFMSVLNDYECKKLQVTMHLYGDMRSVYALIVSPTLIWLSIKWKPLNRLLNIRGLVFLGEISFSMYMWHEPLYSLIHLIQVKTGFPQDTTTMAFFFAVAALLIVVSALSYYFLEKPAQKYLLKKLCWSES